MELSKDEIIRMAREAGFDVEPYLLVDAKMDRLERFAALVAAHERNRHAWTQEHWTEYEHAIAAAEREACAKVCEELNKTWSIPFDAVDRCAAAIRARSQNG